MRGAVLEALACAIDAGEDDDGAVRRLRFDPVLLPLARRRLRRAVLDAMLQAPRGDGPELCQRAYLITAGSPAPEDADTVAVAARFAAARAAAGRPPRVTYFATALVASGALALAGLLVFALWRAAHPAPKDAWHRRGPPPTGVFASGGVAPAVEPAVAAVFQRRLVDFLLRLDRLGAIIASGADDASLAALRTQVDAAAQDVATDCASALPAPVCTRLATLVAAAREQAGHEGDAKQQAFLDAVGRLDDELAAAGLALYVDGDVITEGSGRRYVVLYSFVVEAVHLYRGGGREVRALWLRRLDRLNWGHAAAGFVRPNLREALVLLDQTENELIDLLLPALAEDAPLPLSGQAGRSDADANYDGRYALEHQAGAVMRREWRAALGDDAGAAVARLGDRLAQRTRALVRLTALLDERGLVAARPRGLRLPDGLVTDLMEGLPADAVDELGAVEELARLDTELASEAAAAGFGAARTLLAGTIEVHEVQHRLDYAAAGRRMPAALAALVGPAEVQGEERRSAASARDEMSAYLSQLARSEALVGTSLALIARFLLDRGFWGGAECHAALVIFEGLARELALPIESLLVARTIDRAAVARTVGALLALPPADVARAAARLWQALYGEELARLERLDR